MATVTIIKSKKTGKETELTSAELANLQASMGNKFKERFIATTKEVTDPTERSLKTPKTDNTEKIKPANP